MGPVYAFQCVTFGLADALRSHPSGFGDFPVGLFLGFIDRLLFVLTRLVDFIERPV